MPFSSISGLPESVRNALPTAAQRQFLQVVNSQLEAGLSEERAFASAWGALKRSGWKKGDNGKWRQVQKSAIIINKNTTNDIIAEIMKLEAVTKDLHNSNDGSLCDFCENPAVKAMLWAGGSQHLFVCSGHIETGMRQIIDGNRDAVNQVIDLMPPSSEQDGTQVTITISKSEKEEEEMEDIKKEFPILKRDDDKQLVTGVVLEPEVEDAHGDVISEAEVEQAAHDFMRKSRVIGLQHKELGPAEVVESFIAKEEMNIGDEKVVKGAWVMTVKVHDTDIWKAVKSGEFTGFSIGGTGVRS